MNAITLAANEKNGDYVKSIAGPANRSEELQFGVVDGAIIAFFLLCVSGLGCLLLLG